MIVINGSQIIDVKQNEFTINTGILNDTIVYSKNIQIIGALEINTGDASDYGLIINKKIYTNIEIVNLDNNNGIIIKENKISFIQNGEYNIELRYKSISKKITINVIDLMMSLA